MPNHGYADDDGSRAAQGQHDEGRQRPSIYDVERLLRPATLADMATNSDPLNNRTDSSGNQNVSNGHWAVDGRASAGTAAYPPKPEDSNARD